MADFVAGDVTVTLMSRPGRRLVEGVREVYADVKFGDGAKTYNTGGVPLPALGVFGFHHELLFMHIENPLNGYVYAYDRTNHTLKILYGNYDAADGPLIELADSTAPAEVTLRVKLEGN